jgi:hypothetical protein
MRCSRSGWRLWLHASAISPWFPMVIVAPMGASVTEYRDRFFECLAALLHRLGCPTPACSQADARPLTRHQVRDRAAWASDARDEEPAAHRVPIARLHCAACGHTHTLLPDLLCPFVATWSRCSTAC